MSSRDWASRTTRGVSRLASLPLPFASRAFAAGSGRGSSKSRVRYALVGERRFDLVGGGGRAVNAGQRLGAPSRFGAVARLGDQPVDGVADRLGRCVGGQGDACAPFVDRGGDVGLVAGEARNDQPSARRGASPASPCRGRRGRRRPRRGRGSGRGRRNSSTIALAGAATSLGATMPPVVATTRSGASASASSVRCTLSTLRCSKPVEKLTSASGRSSSSGQGRGVGTANFSSSSAGPTWTTCDQPSCGGASKAARLVEIRRSRGRHRSSSGRAAANAPPSAACR